jgi:hypothetical protein
VHTLICSNWRSSCDFSTLCAQYWITYKFAMMS